MANASQAESSLDLKQWLPLVVAFLVFLVGVAFCTRPALTGSGSSHFPGALYLIFTDLWLALAWVGAAFGFGSCLQPLVLPDTRSPRTIALVIGSAALLWFDHLLGVLGALQLAGGVPAWGLIVLGLIAAALEMRRAASKSESTKRPRPQTSQPIASRWWIILFAPPAAILFTAAASAPGYLWDSEFGGYDVLEYHLQLPREWLAVGRIVPLEHNAYSFLPSYVESAYYHIAVLADPFANHGSNGAVRAAIACQFLHAMFALISAGVIAQLIVTPLTASRKSKNRTSMTPSVLLLTTTFASIPWLIVTGSMAYTELPMLAFFTGALLILFQCKDRDDTSGVDFVSMLTVGFLLGCACGAKLTAFGFVAVPTIITMVFVIPRSRLISAFAAIALGGFIALAPYAVRNYIATDYSNPVFPFSTSVFGTAHWSSEQAARWNAAHRSPHLFDVAAHATALWNMAIVRFEWAGLWIITGVFTIVGALMKSTRRLLLISLIMLVVQLVFWIGLTHEQSRFLIPCAVPMLLIMATPLIHWDRSTNMLLQRAALACSAILCAGVMLIAFVHYQQQRSGRPAALIDGIHFLTGDNLAADDLATLARDNPIVFLNATAPLEPGRVFLLGDATPFYLQRPAYYHTTWDSSPLGNAIRAHPEDPAQWLTALKDQIEIRYLLINWSELDRLINRDQWYDPDVTVERVHLALNRSNRATRKIAEWPAGSSQAGTNPRLELFEIR